MRQMTGLEENHLTNYLQSLMAQRGEIFNSDIECPLLADSCHSIEALCYSLRVVLSDINH